MVKGKHKNNTGLVENISDPAAENAGTGINTDVMNIDTMREESKESDSLMNIKDNKSIDPTGDIGQNKNEQAKDEPSQTIAGIITFIKKIYRNVENAWNSYVNISAGNLLIPVLFFIGMIIYLEIISHLLIYRSIDIKVIYPVLFAIPFGILAEFITGIFNSLMNRILFWMITVVSCLIFAVQLVYFYVFKVYFSFQTIGMAGDAVSEFNSQIMTAIKANLGGIILILLPVFLLGIGINRLIDYNRRGLKLQVVLFAATAIFHIVAVVTLLLFGKGDYTPYDLYHHSRVQNMCGKELGVITMTRIDIVNLIGGGRDDLVLADTMALQTPNGTSNIKTVEKPTAVPTAVPAAPALSEEVLQPEVTAAPTPVPINTSPNVMEIDFNALAEKEKNSTFKTLDQYFSSAVPTNKNKYTGMFKGYNLILITAEGFSPFAVNQEKTPTLYRLVNEGFVFNNFYTALWQTSTSDGEYAALTGLIPTGSRNMYNSRNNYWPFSLGNQFDQLGVASKAYHDHTYTYYQRNETHPNLGYIFKAKGNGLILEHPDTWPESDLEMINATVDEYVNEKQFHIYYLTVSGHMNYSFNGNMMSYKNKSLVEDMPYSDDVKAYIACQIELDKALEQLIKKLEEAGVADRTVIALSADHYPYAWDKSIIDEAAGHSVEPNFEMYKNNFILWNEGMKEKVVIDEPCSSLDILPTLSNLFGLEYDSRLLMGQDILSDAPPLVILSNRSFITDKVMYNSETGEVSKLTSEELPENYIVNMNKIIGNKFSISKSILKEDYYRHLFKDNSKQ